MLWSNMDTFLAQVTKKIFLFALMKQINTIVCFTLAFFFFYQPSCCYVEYWTVWVREEGVQRGV